MSPDNIEKDPWETGSGMVDDVDGTMTECFFGTDERYNADAVLFCSTLVDAAGEPITTLKYSVGEGWETNADGSEIMHPTKTQINQSSRFGYFIDRIAKPNTEKAPKDSRLVSPPGKEKGLGIGNVIRPRGTPFQAKTFEGLTFHWDLHKGATLGKDEKNEVIYKDVLYPTRYIGVQGAQPTAAAPTRATGRAAAPAPAAAPAQTTAGPTNGEIAIPGNMRTKLQLLALQNDQKAFTKAVVKDKEITALSEDVLGHLLDTSAEGFHAKANA